MNASDLELNIVPNLPPASHSLPVRVGGGLPAQPVQASVVGAERTWRAQLASAADARPHRTPQARVRGLGDSSVQTIRTYKEKANMRSIKLTTVFAAAGALLALAPAAASAHHGHHFKPSRRSAAGCRVTLQVAPRLVYSGGKVTASGRLSCTGSGPWKARQ